MTRRAEGENGSFTLELGRLPLGFTLEDGRLRAALKARYRPFLSRRAPAYAWRVRALPTAASHEPVPFIPRLESRPGGFSFSRGDVQCRWTEGRTGELKVWANPYSFDAALRVLYARLLAERGGFLLHAAALRERGRVGLFPGASGAGKTTLVRACPAAAALSDELVLVRKSAGGYIAEATPFWGNGRTAPANIEGRVAGLFFLDRRPPRLEPLSKADARRLLLKRLVWFAEESPRRLEAVWEGLLGLAESVPARRFSFDRRTSPWPLLKEALA